MSCPLGRIPPVRIPWWQILTIKLVLDRVCERLLPDALPFESSSNAVALSIFTAAVLHPSAGDLVGEGQTLQDWFAAVQISLAKATSTLPFPGRELQSQGWKVVSGAYDIVTVPVGSFFTADFPSVSIFPTSSATPSTETSSEVISANSSVTPSVFLMTTPHSLLLRRSPLQLGNSVEVHSSFEVAVVALFAASLVLTFISFAVSIGIASISPGSDVVYQVASFLQSLYFVPYFTFLLGFWWGDLRFSRVLKCTGSLRLPLPMRTTAKLEYCIIMGVCSALIISPQTARALEMGPTMRAFWGSLVTWETLKSCVHAVVGAARHYEPRYAFEISEWWFVRREEAVSSVGLCRRVSLRRHSTATGDLL